MQLLNFDFPGPGQTEYIDIHGSTVSSKGILETGINGAVAANATIVAQPLKIRLEEVNPGLALPVPVSLEHVDPALEGAHGLNVTTEGSTPTTSMDVNIKQIAGDLLPSRGGYMPSLMFAANDASLPTELKCVNDGTLLTDTHVREGSIEVNGINLHSQVHDTDPPGDFRPLLLKLSRDGSGGAHYSGYTLPILLAEYNVTDTIHEVGCMPVVPFPSAYPLLVTEVSKSDDVQERKDSSGFEKID